MVLKTKTVYGAIIFILCIAVAILVYTLINTSQSASGQLSRLSKLIELPNNEQPTIAEVTDPSKLTSSLKSSAKSGDLVIIYSKNAKVILYRPGVNKIIDVQPLLIGSEPNSDLNVDVAILNGSGDPAKLSNFIRKLYTKYPNVRLVYKEEAPRRFPTTIVFAQASDDGLNRTVAEGLSIQAGQAPEGVSDKLAKLTFIVGEDDK